MIGRIRGELVEKQPPFLLVDVNGVGYDLQASMSTVYALPEVGQAVTLLTHLLVREDAHTLYAFATEAERTLFRALLKVNGIGARMALAILSSMNPDEFRQCISSSDQAALVRVPGIGKKTAERLIVEMRDKLSKLGDSPANSASLKSSLTAGNQVDPIAEACEALMALGYRQQDANKMVGKIDSAGLRSEDIIRLALKASL